MRSPLPVVVLATATVLALTGCIGSQTPTPPVATIEQVDVPDSMLASQPSVSVGGRILPATGSLPWLVGGAEAAPGEGGKPTVWTSPDGAAWTAVAVDADIEGAFSGVIGGSETLAALAGTVWIDGVSTSVLWTSADAEDWTERDLPDAFARDFRISDVAVADETVIAIATDVDGAARGIRIERDDATEFDLPAVADDDLLGPIQLLASGDDLILVAAPGPEGSPSASVTYVSDDDGDSWNEPAEIASGPGFIAGIAAVDGGYVATGASARDSASAATGAAAWFSPDARSWTAETVPVSAEGPLFYASSADAWLGMPHSGPGGVTAVLANDNASVSGRVRPRRRRHLAAGRDDRGEPVERSGRLGRLGGRYEHRRPAGRDVVRASRNLRRRRLD